MTRRMLINAQRAEELRLAIVSGDTLDEYQVAVAEAGLLRGNVYRAVVVSLQPSLNAAFVDFGAPKHGFLACHDVVPQAYHHTPPAGTKGAPRIDQVLERGKPVLVQVTKDPSGEKGAALTTNVSLAGRYLVLMPFDEVRGISRKVEDEQTPAGDPRPHRQAGSPRGVRLHRPDQRARPEQDGPQPGPRRAPAAVEGSPERGGERQGARPVLHGPGPHRAGGQGLPRLLHRRGPRGRRRRLRAGADAMRHFMPRAKITVTRYTGAAPPVLAVRAGEPDREHLQAHGDPAQRRLASSSKEPRP